MAADDKTTGKAAALRPVGANVAAFLKQVSSLPVQAAINNGRLMFAMDATASRAPMWQQAIAIQADMFREAAAVGGLDVQLVYYRGLMEVQASAWMSDPARMIAAMRGVQFLSGQTQIERILKHAADETRRKKVNALVFIGDAMEEMPDLVEAAAGQLGLLGVPVFVFHEGGGEPAATTFKRIAAMTRGAYEVFDSASPQKLRDLLRAVAVFAAGGRKALADYGKRAGGEVLRLTRQMGAE
ncbi:MAG: VWA domain-containing protein [Rhodospirillaceae bacterium]|nr:VWA domain-containing protein [Rhodospirillaceae bacterium]